MSPARILSDVLELFYGPVLQMENRWSRRLQQPVRIPRERYIDIFIRAEKKLGQPQVLTTFFVQLQRAEKTFFVQPHTDRAQTTHTDLEDRPR